MLIKKEKKDLLSSGLCCPGGPQSENERKRKDQQILGPCQTAKKSFWNMRVTAIPAAVGEFGTVSESLEK